MINPCSVRVESHPSGALVDLLLDVNKPDDVRVSLTRDLACILKSQLDMALTR
jgi:hypothetical protein